MVLKMISASHSVLVQHRTTDGSYTHPYYRICWSISRSYTCSSCCFYQGVSLILQISRVILHIICINIYYMKIKFYAVCLRGVTYTRVYVTNTPANTAYPRKHVPHTITNYPLNCGHHAVQSGHSFMHKI